MDTRTPEEIQLHDYMTRLDALAGDVKTHGIIFNFQDEQGKLKTGIIRKGQFDPTVFKNGWLPNYRKMTRKERRTL